MATFIDEDENNQQQADEELSFDSLDEQAEDSVEEQPSQVEEEDDDIPEKYRGKSVKEIVRMHQEAEKAMGKQGSEVGELRRLVDSFIQAQSVSKQQAPTVEEEVDFFADPEVAIAKAIEKHPKVRQAEEMAAQMQKAQVMAQLQTTHPDFKEILSNEGFQEWIGKSKVRQELFKRADANFDFDAADELFSSWKERTQVVKQTEEVEKISRKNAVKTAATGSSRGSGESSKKTYRRVDIIELMQRDPERYLALEPDIKLAYAEGRVR